MCLPHIITLLGCEERMEAQRGTKVTHTVAAVAGKKAHLGTK